MEERNKGRSWFSQYTRDFRQIRETPTKHDFIDRITCTRQQGTPLFFGKVLLSYLLTESAHLEFFRAAQADADAAAVLRDRRRGSRIWRSIAPRRLPRSSPQARRGWCPADELPCALPPGSRRKRR